MNILHTVFSFNNGGIENLLIDMTNNWNKENDRLFICIVNDDYNSELLKRIDNHDNVEIIVLNRKRKSKSIKFIIEYINIVIKNKIDIIHCHLFEAVKIASIAKLIKPQIRLFYTVHDTNIYHKFSKKDIILQNIFINKIIAISQSVKNQIIRKNNKNDVEVVYNDINRFSEATRSNEYIRIGCVARILPEKKGQDILIKAISIVKEKYPNVKCIFAGEPMKGHEHYLKELISQCENEGLLNNIIFKGNVDDIPSFLSSLDIFVLPSRYEGFGIAILEAMASKVPVIASKLEGPQEIIKNDEYGLLFEVGSHKMLAELIIKVIEENNQGKINKAYEYINNEFSIDRINFKIRQIYLNHIKEQKWQRK